MFQNTLRYTEDFNPYVYRNFYNGGGVALGDINNDGLTDIYFTGNLVANKLFINKGGWQFDDISISAGVSCPNVWSTGATFVDINADGLLDLYVCKSGKPGGTNRHNELFINNGDLTFTERSEEYGLDITGLSVQAAFFDYDKDGDLDCYLLNNSIRSVGAFDLAEGLRDIPDPNGNGNKLLRNDNGFFKDVSNEAGIYSSSIGFGLGITLGDFNQDHWTDMYISNDFFERDYLYINNQKGGFSEELESYFSSISMGSMGADYADLDNDLLPELMVTEMLPKTEARQKTKTVFETWDKQQLAIKQGYFKQFSRNTLQKNLGNSFIDLARQTKTAATEWSWSILFFDADNDGLRDIFVSNGIYKDLLDRDYLAYEANDNIIKTKLRQNEPDVIKNLIDAMPTKAVPNVAYKNMGDFQFSPKTNEWGLGKPSFSNGSAYGDLDNDGDLDLIINNVNMPSFVYENTSDTIVKNSITIKLSQSGKNKNSIGSKLLINYGGGELSYQENYNAKGFQSSIANTVHFGLGPHTVVDTLWILWPDLTESMLTNLKTNQAYHIHKEDTTPGTPRKIVLQRNGETLKETKPLFEFEHQENKFVDFNRERLLIQMYSNEGPAFATADINQDGIPDYFVGGAKQQSAALFESSPNGYKTLETPFFGDKNSEDTQATFFDGDSDGDLDLYVCHGGRSYSRYSAELHDIYYENKKGTLVKAKIQPKFPKPINTAIAAPYDFDHDGDMDLFLGERFQTDIYGLPTSGYFLKNDGKGNFKLASPKNMQSIGMITDAKWCDINGDSWLDLVIVGEWMSIKIYINNQGELEDHSQELGLQQTEGLWSALEVLDIDGDGDNDLVVGNLGTNTFFEVPMRMFIGDFDGNGFQEQLICKKNGEDYYPIVDKDELISQIPALKKSLVYYRDYAKAKIEDIVGPKGAGESYIANLTILESAIFKNENGTFVPEKLPHQIQASPVYAIESGDIDQDGAIDLLLGGNQHLVKPQFGSYDASGGWVIFAPDFLSPSSVEPLHIQGQIRHLHWDRDRKMVIATRNNDSTLFFKPND